MWPHLVKRIRSSLTRFLKKMVGIEDVAVDRITQTRDLFERALEDAKQKRQNGMWAEQGVQYSIPENDWHSRVYGKKTI